MSFTDKTINCRDCGTDFTFTSGEQAFYAEKGFTNEPTRCSNCRRANKESRGGGRSSYSSRDSYSSYGSDRGQREMHSATCSACGREAQVPFVPRGDKPIYCSDCFRSQRSGGSSRGSSRW